MNQVAVSAEGIPLPVWSKALRRFARKTLEHLGRDKWDLSILLCGDTIITKLNERYRGKNEATDVLSFAQDEGDDFPSGGGRGRQRQRRLPGDIVISLDTLWENAARFNINADEELRRLLIHGILHLDGMDHKSNGGDEPMLRLQEEILTQLAGECIPRGNI